MTTPTAAMSLTQIFAVAFIFSILRSEASQVQKSHYSPPNRNAPMASDDGVWDDSTTYNLTVTQHFNFVGHEFLKAHNKVRASKGEPPLKWDSRLARYARSWAFKQVVECRLKHSTGNKYGENVFWASNALEFTPTKAVEEWAKEEKDYDVKTNTCTAGEMCGHYTQIVWRDTTKLGCAFQKCINGGLYVSCNYDPPGNYAGENPFDTHI